MFQYTYISSSSGIHPLILHLVYFKKKSAFIWCTVTIIKNEILEIIWLFIKINIHFTDLCVFKEVHFEWFMTSFFKSQWNSKKLATNFTGYLGTKKLFKMVSQSENFGFHHIFEDFFFHHILDNFGFRHIFDDFCSQ